MRHNVIFLLEHRKDSNGIVINKNMPLFADIHYGSTRLFYFTGFRIDEAGFDAKKHLAMHKQKAFEARREVSSGDINRRIRLITATLINIFDNIQVAPPKEDIVAALNYACKKAEFIEPEAEEEAKPLEFLKLFRTYLDNSRLSTGRKNHAYSTIAHWKRFEKKKHLFLTFESITPDMLRAFEKFLLTEKKLDVVTQEKKEIRGMNTLHTIFTITRTFWNHARKELRATGIEIPYPFESYKVPAEVYGTPIYLTLEERNQLFDAKLESEKLTKVRDIFVFQCLTGARVGDLCRFTKNNISREVLSYIPRKTKEGKPVTVRVPLSTKAKELISRYDMPNGSLMPFITDQRYNVYIKELFKAVGLTRIVTRQHPRTRESENVRLCDIASSHMARRSFVGNMFGKVDSAIIASMSGHVANSKSFARYHDISEELQLQAINLID